MKTIRFTILSSLALALLGPCFGTAYAQGLTGKFTLPFEARWGLATLKAGDYKFTLDHAPGGMLHLYRGAKPVAFIVAETYAPKVTGRPSLTVTTDSIASTIRELALPDAGLVLYYPQIKPKRGSALEEQRTAQMIPVTVTGGGL